MVFPVLLGVPMNAGLGVLKSWDAPFILCAGCCIQDDAKVGMKAHAYVQAQHLVGRVQITGSKVRPLGYTVSFRTALAI